MKTFIMTLTLGTLGACATTGAGDSMFQSQAAQQISAGWINSIYSPPRPAPQLEQNCWSESNPLGGYRIRCL